MESIPPPFRAARILNMAAYGIMAAVSLSLLWQAFSLRYPNRWFVLGLLLAVAALFVLHSRKDSAADSRRTHLYLAVQALLIAILEMNNPSYFGAAVLFFMLSAQAATSFPWRTSLVWVGLFTLFTAVLLVVRGGLDALPILPIYGGGYFFFAAFAHQTHQAEEARHESQQLLAALQEAHRQLQEYAVQVEELAVAQERNRLAREMHDTLGHRLTVSVVQLEGAERLIPDDPARATQMVKTVREQVRAALGELRRIVAALRPPLEADLPLPRAIVRLTDEFQKATGIAVHRSLPPAIPPLPPAWRLTLYRTVQEGLTNVQRHADARRVWLAVQVNDQMLTLRLSDDGRGWSPGEPQQGFGLRGLRERAHQLGGELHLETGLKGGAAIILRLPLPAEGRDD